MKQYQKPEVFYENFVLAEHIALCANKLGHNDIAVCTVTDANNNCTVKMNFYCYTNSTLSSMLFNS